MKLFKVRLLIHCSNSSNKYNFLSIEIKIKNLILVNPPYSKHHLYRTPLYDGHFSQKQIKRRSNSHNKSGNFIADISPFMGFRSQCTLLPTTDLSVADTPNNMSKKGIFCKKFVYISFWVIY